MNRFIGFMRRNIRRAPYQAVAASMVMFITFLILILFSVLLIGAQRILQYYEQRPQAIAFFKDTATATDVAAIQQRLAATGKTTEVKYVSKQDALKYYNQMNKDEPILLELVTANILPASLEISTTSPDDLISIADMVKKEPVVDDVLVPKDVIQTITQIIDGIRWVGAITATFLVVFSFFLLLMVIGFKIRIRRTEIETMKLLGASTWFIRIPFLLEGITYGVIGAFFAWAVSFGALYWASPRLKIFLQGIPPNIITIPPPLFLVFGYLGVAILVGIIIGALGSYAAVRRYLKL